MPLRDHFHPPLSEETAWESFHSNWATKIADALSDLVPREYRVEEYAHHGPSVEIDVATFERPSTSSGGPATAILNAPVYSPPAPAQTMAAIFPDTFEVRVFRTRAGKTLVAAIELVSPGNKDRPTERRAFAAKCASYLSQGVGLIVIDIVSERRANLHNETMRLMDAAPELDFPAEVSLYAVAYRPLRRGERDEIDLWPRTLAVGDPLPTLPLRLTGDLFVPVPFEATYQEACRRRHID
jgi:hypothetical protein